MDYQEALDNFSKRYRGTPLTKNQLKEIEKRIEKCPHHRYEIKEKDLPDY